MAEHPRRRAPAAQAAWLLPLLALVSGCAATPADASGDPAPVVDDATAPPPPADLATEAGAAPDGPVAENAPSPPKVAEPTFGPEGDYFPAPLSIVHFAGLQFLPGAKTAPIRIVQKVEEKTGVRVPFAQSMRVGEESLEESFVAEVTPRGLRVGLASGQLRVVPPPVLEMPRKPRIGQTWSVDLGGHSALCLIEAVDTARTFVGDVPACVRIRIEHPGGAVHRRWYHPEKGLVRAEARDPRGRLLSGWALSESSDPPPEAFERLFRRDG